MMNFSPKKTGHDSPNHENSTPPRKNYFSLLKFWLRSLVREDRGAVGILMIGLAFLGLMFTGIAIDYARYVEGARRIQGFADGTALMGAGRCRMLYIQYRKPTQPGIPDPGHVYAFSQAQSTAPRHISNYVQDNIDLSLPKGMGATVDLGSAKIDELQFAQSSALDPNATYCRVAIPYTGHVTTIFSKLFGMKEWVYRGRVTSVADLSGIWNPKLEIDFLIDTSGSMSTISDPKDRDLMMYLMANRQVYAWHSSNGCIFLCHSREALMNGEKSAALIDANDNYFPKKTTYWAQADYHAAGTPNTLAGNGYGYNGNSGKHLFDLTDRAVNLNKKLKRYKSIDNMTLCNPSAGSPQPECTKKNAPLVRVGEVLEYFDIELKSDQLFDNLRRLIDLLKTRNSNRAGDIKLAFHRFSSSPNKNVVRTVIPDVGGDTNKNQLPLSDPIFDVNNPYNKIFTLGTFDYDVPNSTDPARDDFYARIFPIKLNLAGSQTYDNTAHVFAPAADSSPFPNSVTLDTLRSQNYESVKNILPYDMATDLEGALTEMLAKIKSRTPSGKPPNDTARVLVVFTDGIKSGGHISIKAKDCQAIKDDNIVLMIIHSYYRLQPGANASRVTARVVLNDPNVSPERSDVDHFELRINDKIGDVLAACATPNKSATLNQKGAYYFPANYKQELADSFDHLVVSLMGITAQGSPVKIIE